MARARAAVLSGDLESARRNFHALDVPPGALHFPHLDGAARSLG
jgi:hypothetical protein